MYPGIESQLKRYVSLYLYMFTVYHSCMSLFGCKIAQAVASQDLLLHHCLSLLYDLQCATMHYDVLRCTKRCYLSVVTSLFSQLCSRLLCALPRSSTD